MTYDDDELIDGSAYLSHDDRDDYDYRDETDEEVIFWTPPKESPSDINSIKKSLGGRKD
jgi:hypothetical protein